MATSFFGGSFFNGEFFHGTSTVKKGSNWTKNKLRDDEMVLMAVLHSYYTIERRLSWQKKVKARVGNAD